MYCGTGIWPVLEMGCIVEQASGLFLR